MTPDFPDDDPMKPIRYIVQNGTADAIIINRIRPKDPRVRYLMDIGFVHYWWLNDYEEAARWFPRGSVHVVVVDPGVGTGRRALAVRAGDEAQPTVGGQNHHVGRRAGVCLASDHHQVVANPGWRRRCCSSNGSRDGPMRAPSSSPRERL